MACLMIGGELAVQPSLGDSAYLPSVGSPSLRFQVVTTNHWVFTPNLPALKVKPMETSNVVMQTKLPESSTSTDDTNVAKTINQISMPVKTNEVVARLETATNENSNIIQSPNFGVSSSTAGDLLTVTPQMIANYLKPAQNEADQGYRQGSVTFVPPEMQFIPPVPKAPAESRATYKTQ